MRRGSFEEWNTSFFSGMKYVVLFGHGIRRSFRAWNNPFFWVLECTCSFGAVSIVHCPNFDTGAWDIRRSELGHQLGHQQSSNHWTQTNIAQPKTNPKQNDETEDVPLVEFMYRVFTRMPGESYRRRLRSLLLCLCCMFGALINPFVCWQWIDQLSSPFVVTYNVQTNAYLF